MVGVGADAEMEGVLSAGLDHVLVGANTGSLESLRGELLQLVGDKVDAEGELVNAGALAAEVENADLSVGHTTVEARLGVLQSFVSAMPFVVAALNFDSRRGVVVGHLPACSCSSGSNGRVVGPLCRWLWGF